LVTDDIHIILTDDPNEVAGRIQSVYALDLETHHPHDPLDPFISEVVQLQIAVSDDTCYVIQHPESLESLFDVLRDPSRLCLMHNACFDLKFLKHHFNCSIDNVWDTFLAAKILGKRRASLSHLARELGFELQPIVYDRVRIGALHAALLFPIWRTQRERIEETDQSQVLALEHAAIPATVDLELSGIYLDAEELKKVLTRWKEKRDQLRSELSLELSDGPGQLQFDGTVVGRVNINSPKQLREALQRRGIKLSSTSATALRAELRKKHHPILERLLEYRIANKIVTHYGQSLIRAVHRKTNRVHPTYWQIGALSGRYACSAPNLQTIPTDPEFRHCFHAEPGRVFVIADYEQQELRILAQLSRDRAMIDGLKEDIHSYTAEHFNLSRKAAKNLNYGLLYGLGPESLAIALEIKPEDAIQLIAEFFDLFSGVKSYFSNALAETTRTGYVTTLSGRRIELEKSDARFERWVRNVPVQGSGADMLKLALGDMVKPLNALDAHIVLILHDEVIVEAPSEVVDDVVEIVGSR